MKVSIRNKPADILLSTISLAIDRQNPDNLLMFRCYHCSTVITQVKGNVISIFSGLVPTNEVVVIHQCYKCHANYTFQTILPPKKHHITTLKLAYTDTIETFHCIICRTQLLQYDAKLVASLPEHKKQILPWWFYCFKPDCQKEYLLNEIVSVVL